MDLKTICAVGSDDKEEYVKSLGADEVVRYDKSENGNYRVKDTMGRIWFIDKNNLSSI